MEGHNAGDHSVNSNPRNQPGMVFGQADAVFSGCRGILKMLLGQMTWRKRLPTTDWCIHADSMRSTGSVSLAVLPFSSSDSSCIGSSLRVQTGSSSSTAYKGECQWKGLQEEDYLNPTCAVFLGVTVLFFLMRFFFINTKLLLTYRAQLSLVLAVGLVCWQWLGKGGGYALRLHKSFFSA